MGWQRGTCRRQERRQRCIWHDGALRLLAGWVLRRQVRGVAEVWVVGRAGWRPCRVQARVLRRSQVLLRPKVQRRLVQRAGRLQGGVRVRRHAEAGLLHAQLLLLLLLCGWLSLQAQVLLLLLSRRQRLWLVARGQRLRAVLLLRLLLLAGQPARRCAAPQAAAAQRAGGLWSAVAIRLTGPDAAATGTKQRAQALLGRRRLGRRRSRRRRRWVGLLLVRRAKELLVAALHCPRLLLAALLQQFQQVAALVAAVGLGRAVDGLLSAV